MSQGGYQRDSESFNSFLAGVLLTRNCINNFDFFAMMNDFEEIYNVDIVSDKCDICVPIYLDDNKIRLPMSIDSIICINGKNIIIRNYLLSIVSPRVREFFQISDLKIVDENKYNSFVKLLRKNRNKAII